MLFSILHQPDGVGFAELAQRDPDSLEVGLINNMPDTALRATERQFVSLLDSAANGLAVRLRLFTLPAVPRSSWAQAHVESFYSSLDDLWASDVDALIVTGTEPRASNL